MSGENMQVLNVVIALEGELDPRAEHDIKAAADMYGMDRDRVLQHMLQTYVNKFGIKFIEDAVQDYVTSYVKDIPNAEDQFTRK